MTRQLTQFAPALFGLRPALRAFVSRLPLPLGFGRMEGSKDGGEASRVRRAADTQTPILLLRIQVHYLAGFERGECGEHFRHQG
jgi:hypothetical protein